MSDKSCPHDRGDIWLSGDGVYTSKRANPACVFCPKDSMTPSEKKAMECIDAGNKCPCIKGDDACEEHQIEAIVLALDAAERRGFERAKRMAVEALPDFKIHNLEYAKLIENLKYEEA